MPALLSKLIEEVEPDAPKCGKFTLRQAIEDATIEFFKDSRVMNVDLTEIPLVVDVAEYELPNPDGFQIVTTRIVEVDNKPMHPTSEEQLQNEWDELSRGFAVRYYNPNSGGGADAENWRYATSDRPWLHYLKNPNLMRVVGIPTLVTTVGLRVNVIVHPVPGVTTIPDWIYNSHKPTIVARALSDLMGSPNKAYSNAREAMRWDEFYWDKVNALKNAALRGHQRNDNANLRTRTWR